MADTSRSQVTITLGRSGQVVKRAGAVLDRELSGPVPGVGSKRSVRDRLGTTLDAVQLDNKRLRADNGRWNLKASNCMDDFHLSKDDLRFKIMKRTQSNGQQNNVDLRDMLSRRTRPATTKPVTPHSVHEPRHGRQRSPEISPEPRRRVPEPRRHVIEPRNERQFMAEPRDERRHMVEPRDDRRRMAESRDDRQRMAEPRDSRQSMAELNEVRQRIPKLNEGRQRIPVPTNSSMAGQFTSMRTSDAPSQMDLLRNSYSPWTLDHIRRKSPDRVLNNSRGSSPPPPLRRAEEPPPPLRRAEEPPQRRTMIRAFEDPRTVPYASRDVSEISRPMTTTSFLSKPSLTAGPTKPVGPLVAPSLPPGGILQRSQYPVEEHLTVEGFLRSLGLDKYVISFKVEEVDMAALSQMGDHDLKELGIPMGPRKKILLGLVARARRLAR